jgi:hypothetical protein
VHCQQLKEEHTLDRSFRTKDSHIIGVSKSQPFQPQLQPTTHLLLDCPWQIRPNLHAALVELRSPDPANEVALWVDAICMHNLKIFARIQVFLKVLEQLTPFPFKISTV